MIYLTLLALAFTEVFIIDLSGFINNGLKPMVRKMFGIQEKTNIRIPILECSLCTTFHTGWITLLIMGEFTVINLLYISILSFLTPVMGGLLLWFKDLLITILDKLNRLL